MHLNGWGLLLYFYIPLLYLHNVIANANFYILAWKYINYMLVHIYDFYHMNMPGWFFFGQIYPYSILIASVITCPPNILGVVLRMQWLSLSITHRFKKYQKILLVFLSLYILLLIVNLIQFGIRLSSRYRQIKPMHRAHKKGTENFFLIEKKNYKGLPFD